MSGVTPILKLPFPSDTDPADVPADIQALGLGIEAVRGTANGLASTDGQNKVPTAQIPLIIVPLLTTLSTEKVDGKEFVLCDKLNDSSYTWRLRFTTLTTGNRWDFLGGTPARAAVAAAETTTTIGSYVNLATLGPRFTIPFAGDYLVRFGCTVIDSAADSQINLGVGVGDFTAPLAEARGHISAANYHQTIIGEAQLNGLGAGAEVRAKYQHAIAGTLTVRDRWLAVTPIHLAP
jgi:hypothetical protein